MTTSQQTASFNGSRQSDKAGSLNIPWRTLIGVGLLILFVAWLIFANTGHTALRSVNFMAGDTLIEVGDCGSRMGDCINFLLLAAANSIDIGDASIKAGEATNTLVVNTTGQNYQAALVFAQNVANLGYTTEFTGFFSFVVDALIISK